MIKHLQNLERIMPALTGRNVRVDKCNNPAFHYAQAVREVGVKIMRPVMYTRTRTND